jgi:hypothetical protein
MKNSKLLNGAMLSFALSIFTNANAADIVEIVSNKVEVFSKVDQGKAQEVVEKDKFSLPLAILQEDSDWGRYKVNLNGQEVWIDASSAKTNNKGSAQCLASVQDKGPAVGSLRGLAGSCK